MAADKPESPDASAQQAIRHLEEEPPQRTPADASKLPSSPLSTDAMAPGPLPLPKWFAAVAVVCAVLLVPWIIYLAYELPTHARADNYDVAWVGFDLAMFLALGAMAVAALKRSTWTEPLATCAATMLVVDAWFDVITASHAHARLSALASAVFLELPLAVMCGWVAHNTERLRRRAYRKLWRRVALQEAWNERVADRWNDRRNRDHAGRR